MQRVRKVQHCLEYFGFQHPDLELEWSARSVVQFEEIFPDAAPGVAYAPVDLDGQVSVMVDVSPEVYELVSLFVYLTGCLDAGYGSGIRLPLRAQTHDLSLGLRNGKTKRRAHGHDHNHHLPELLRRLRDDSGIVSV